jgi:SAM-dependent methyltransferase
MVILPAAAVAVSPPSPWVRRFAPLVAPGAPVLDLACGHGRHARYFSRRGHPVLAIDRDPGALAALNGEPGVTILQCDLETGRWPLGEARFGAVIVSRYLHRPRLAAVLAAVAADGVLLYETFARGNEAIGKPSNPDFLLDPDELLDRFGAALTIVAFEQGREDTAEMPAVVQRIAAVGCARTWPPLLPPGLAVGNP